MIAITALQATEMLGCVHEDDSRSGRLLQFLPLLIAVARNWELRLRVVWGYALAWFFVNDRIKLAAYRILNPLQPVLSTHK